MSKIRLNEQDIKNMVRLAAAKLLKESDNWDEWDGWEEDLDDDWDDWDEDRRPYCVIAVDKWFEEWIMSKLDEPNKLLHAKTLLKALQNDDYSKKMVGKILAKENVPSTGNIETAISALITKVERYIEYNTEVKRPDIAKTSNGKDDAERSERLSRFDGYSSDVNYEMNKMWDDRESPIYDWDSYPELNEVSIQHLHKFAFNNVDWNADNMMYVLENKSFTIPELIEYLNDLSNRFNGSSLYSEGEPQEEDELPSSLKQKVIEANKYLGELYQQVLAFATRRKDTSDNIMANYRSKGENIMKSVLKKWKSLGLPTRYDYLNRERPDWNKINSEQEDEFIEMLTRDEKYVADNF